MKPLPILVAAASLTALGAVAYLSIGTTPVSSPPASTTLDGRPLAVSPALISGAGTAPATADSTATSAPDLRIGRSYPVAADSEPGPLSIGGTTDRGPDPTAPTTPSGGISTAHPRPSRSLNPTGAASNLPAPGSTPSLAGAPGSSSFSPTALLGNSDAPASSVPAASLSEDSLPGVLSHPGLTPPAPPKMAGLPLNALAANGADPAAPTVDPAVAAARQRGERPPWPRGPFTPEQELYRAQVGSQNFNLWLTDEARKQREGQ